MSGPGDDHEPGRRRWVDLAPTPWRNGGGVTRELASSPAGDDEFDWRISIADVTASGDFSVFPGVDRTIVQVDGPEMTLTVDDAAHTLVRYRPFEFDGGRPVWCAVPSGPTRDLNVMTRRGRCRATVTVTQLVPSAPLHLPGRPLQLVIPLAGTVSVTVAGGDHRPHDLDRFDLDRTPPATGVVLTGSGPVARIEIQQDR